jgi:hypothetical protein
MSRFLPDGSSGHRAQRNLPPPRANGGSDFKDDNRIKKPEGKIVLVSDSTKADGFPR